MAGPSYRSWHAMRTNTYVTAFLALLLVSTAAGRAQQDVPPSGSVTIRSSVQEVVVDLVVHDKHGKLVKKLDPKDVTLFEDGARQEIRSLQLVAGKEIRAEDFARKSKGTQQAAPAAAEAFNPLRTMNLVCLVFQDLNPETRKWALEAALEFLKNELRANTYIGVFSLDDAGL